MPKFQKKKEKYAVRPQIKFYQMILNFITKIRVLVRLGSSMSTDCYIPVSEAVGDDIDKAAKLLGITKEVYNDAKDLYDIANSLENPEGSG
ncbi:hypothetical protein GUI12_01710 [Anaplasmataceae bacterium AB001_6]|nr:hypothetical protein GUI12_01710 [Anaplasmataceae bacterium AB001_6]